jgi:putative solute:sodium symporter small subunit
MTENDTPAGEQEKSHVYHRESAENQPVGSRHDQDVLSEAGVNLYWRDNKRVLFVLMGVWMVVTFGCGIIFGEWLDQYSLLGFPLGFWFTQQGAMLIYVLLIFVYHIWMKRIEARHGVDDASAEKRQGVSS